MLEKKSLASLVSSPSPDTSWGGREQMQQHEESADFPKISPLGFEFTVTVSLIAKTHLFTRGFSLFLN